jgi:hypothetical protein
MSYRLKFAGVMCGVSLLAACAPATRPPVIAPRVIVTPPPPARPLPPLGAAVSFSLPPIGVDGIRQTPNRSLSANEAVWNNRAALNVAALNCQGPVWDQIAVNYNRFLNNNKKTLSKISKDIDAEYRVRFPNENALRVRDTKLTDLYNYFSLPAVKREYCDMAMIKSQEAAALDFKTIKEYSATSLADVDGIFIRFFDSYAQYERDLADWNRRYAPRPVSVSQPAAGITPSVPAQ